MIPKRIHYIWFGGAKPQHVVRTIDSWKRVLPDYEILEWNEGNFDTSQHPWMERMQSERKYGFTGDWARLHLLKTHGGIYLDTDVEVRKPFDPFLGADMFWGFEYDCYLATCTVGSRPGHPLLDLLLAEYDGREDAPISNAVFTRTFLRHFPEFRLNNHDQQLPDGIRVYGKEYFSVPCSDPEKGFSRHHGTNLWLEGGKRSSPLKKLIRSLLGEVLYFKWVNRHICRINEFGPIHRQHSRG